MIAYRRVFSGPNGSSERKLLWETRLDSEGYLFDESVKVPTYGFHEIHFIDTGRYQTILTDEGYQEYDTGNIATPFMELETVNPAALVARKPETPSVHVLDLNHHCPESSVPLLWETISFGDVKQTRKDGFFLDTESLFLFHVPMGDNKPMGTRYMELSQPLYTELKEEEILSVAMQTRDLYGESERLEAWVSEKNRVRGAERKGVQELLRRKVWGEPEVQHKKAVPCKAETDLSDEDVL